MAIKHRFLLLFTALLLSTLSVIVTVAGALDVQKTVEGQNVLDFGERLEVTIKMDTETRLLKLDRLTDPIPEGFTASITGSSSCSQQESNVICNFGAGAVNGTYAVSYELVAVSLVERVPIKKAALEYTDLESPTFQLTKSSNPISGLYTIGLPMVNLTKAVSVDGTIVKEIAVLPNSRVKIDFRLQNTGAIDAEAVALSVTPPADWSVPRTPESGFVLGAGESKLVNVELSGPQIDRFESVPLLEISATVTWSGGNRTYNPVETRIPVKQVRPAIVSNRHAGIKWKLAGNMLEPHFVASFDLKNTGTAKAIVSVGQEAPGDLGNVKLEPAGSWSSIELAAGESKRLTLSGTVTIIDKQETSKPIILPAASISYSDLKGNRYPYSVPEPLNSPLELSVSKGVFETIFGATSKVYPWGQFAAALLIFISAWGLKTYGRENKHLMLAFGAIGILALLVVVSALKVILP